MPPPGRPTAPRSLPFLPAVALGLLAACSSVPPSPPPPTARPTATPSAEVKLPVETVLQPGATTGEWIVLGLSRSRAEALAVPRVLLVLSDPDGNEVDRRTIDLPIDPLPPDTGWPFREVFQLSTAPAAVTASLLGDRANAPPAPRLETKVLRTFVDADGTPVALGSLLAQGDDPVELIGVRLLARDEDSSISEVLDAISVQTILAGGIRTPFLARGTDAGGPTAWEVFPLARLASGGPPDVNLTSVEAFTDDQGNPFVTVGLENASAGAVWVRLTGVLRVGTTWLAARTVGIGSPVAPGEAAITSILVPGTALGPNADPAGAEWDLFLDLRAAEAETIPIRSEIVGYEPAGSTLILRVRVTAPLYASLDRPAASAVLRSEAGPVVSAVWAEAAPLDAGEESLVVLALPLPRGFDLTASILDVAATGLRRDP